MPIGEAGAQLIGGTAVAGAQMLYNAYQNKKDREFQEKQNKANQQWEWDMYQQTRNDARQDWANQNAYNSPEQQMQRLREAGLNPNLVYGKGADNTSAMVRGGTPGQARGTASRQGSLDIGGAIQTGLQSVMGMAQLKQVQAQTDNLAEQNALLKKEQLFKDASTQKVLQDTATSVFGLEQARALRDTIIKKAQLEVQQGELNLKYTDAQTNQTIANTKYTLDQNQRAKLSQTYDLKKTVQDILESKQRVLESQSRTAVNEEQKQQIAKQIQQIDVLIDGAKKENVLKDLDIELQKNGINKSDPVYWRLMIQKLGNWKEFMENAGESSY